MLDLALTVLLANRMYEMCGHFHYFFNKPIRRDFQKTRAGHTLFTMHDGLTFVLDSLLVSLNPLFVSLAIGHFLVAGLQIVAWERYRVGFFDVVGAQSYYADGMHRRKRVVSLGYDLVGQLLSAYLLIGMLKEQLVFVASALGVLTYIYFTVEAKPSDAKAEVQRVAALELDQVA